MSRAKAKSTTRRPKKAPTISTLYSRFEQAIAARQAILSTDETRWDRANDKCYDVVDLILSTPTASIDEMLLKIRLVGWAAGVPHKRLEDLDGWTPDRLRNGEQYDALASLREDLRRLYAGDRRLQDLAAELEAAGAEQRRLDQNPAATDADHQKAHARTRRVIEAIKASPARSLAGLRVKARAIQQIHRGGPIKLVEKPTTDVQLAQSIVADLLAGACNVRK